MTEINPNRAAFLRVACASFLRVACASFLLVFLLVAGVQLGTAPPADAARGLTTGLFEPDYVSPDASVRDLWFNRTEEANTGLVRVDVYWGSVVGSQRPANPSDPGDPAYDFSAIDRAVRDARERGLEVMFTVISAPDWAEGPDRPEAVEAGRWKPDPEEYGNFGTALAKRYSGSFRDPAGLGALPRVRYFEAWIEPNLTLEPKWEGTNPTGPVIYRRLLNALYPAVKGVHRDNLVIGPGNSPFGEPPGGSRMRPLTFLRELLCLKGRKKPKPKPCPERPHLDVVSHHPISLEGPNHSAIHPDDASGGDLGRVKRIVRAAEKFGTVRPARRRPLWVTEFWWFSNPPSQLPRAVPLHKQARNIEKALYLYWKARARVAIYLSLRDFSNVQTGLFFSDGREKPAFRAFSFPFVTERRSRRQVRAWGKAPSDGKLKIQVRKRAHWRTLKRLPVREGQVFKTRLKLRRSAKLRASVDGERSLVWRERR